MKKVYLARDPVNADLLKELLEDAGIQASVQDERTFALLGGVAAVYPTVWVHDEDYDAARAAVAEFERSQGSPRVSYRWTCPKCGEEIEGRFKECWKCDAKAEEGESITPAKRIPLGVMLFVAVAVVLLLVLLFEWRMSANESRFFRLKPLDRLPPVHRLGH